MADNVLESGPPSAKRPKLSSPALSVSASDGNDFGSLFDLEHDLPDELISSSDLGLSNGGDASQLHTSLGGAIGGQDAAAKHKQLSELLRAGGPTQQGSNSTPPGASMGMMGGVGPGVPQGHGPPQQQPGLMQQQQMGGVAALSRAAAMMGVQKVNAGAPQQQQGMMGGPHMVNGAPRMGYQGAVAMGNNTNILAETLQQQQGGQSMRAQQPGALNKMNMMANSGPYGGPYGAGGPGMQVGGLGLQGKAGLPNNNNNNNMPPQFSMDKKAAAGMSPQQPGAVGGASVGVGYHIPCCLVFL